MQNNTRKKNKTAIGLLFLGVSLMTSTTPTLANMEKIQVSKETKTTPYTIETLTNSNRIDIFTYEMPYLSGKTQDATALVFYPKQPKPKDGWRIAVWTHGTVGIGNACAPSNNPISKNFKGIAEALLTEGYVIVAPDYEGLGTPGIHPYLNLKSEALAAIYAVATIKEIFPNEYHGDWMVIGQSQGGQASLGTAEYANSDIHFKGAVAGAPASNLQMIGEEIMPKTFADLYEIEEIDGIPLADRNSVYSLATILPYLAFMGAGITAIHPEFDYLHLFEPEVQDIAQRAAGTNGEDGLCLGELREIFKADIIDFLEKNPDAKLMDYKGINFKALDNNPILTEFFDASQPGTQKLDKPILIIQGEQDTNVPLAATEKLVDDLNTLGSKNISLVRVKNASHTEAIVWKTDELMEFIKQHMPNR